MASEHLGVDLAQARRLDQGVGDVETDDFDGGARIGPERGVHLTLPAARSRSIKW